MDTKIKYVIKLYRDRKYQITYKSGMLREYSKENLPETVKKFIADRETEMEIRKTTENNKTVWFAVWNVRKEVLQ